MAKRWNSKQEDYGEFPKVDAFIEEVLQVCAKHKMSISHEDGQGAFIIQPFDKDYSDWLQDALVHDGDKLGS